jgi:hypothetical protein
MRYLYHHNPLIRAAASLGLVAAITAIALMASGCDCEPYDRNGNPVENCPPAAI